MLNISHGTLQTSSRLSSTSFVGPHDPNSLASRLSGVVPTLSRGSLGLSDISGSEGLEEQVIYSSCYSLLMAIQSRLFSTPFQEMPHTSRPSLLCTSTGLLDPDDLNTSSANTSTTGRPQRLGLQFGDVTDGPEEVTSGPLENTSGVLDLTSASLEPGDITPTPLNPEVLVKSSSDPTLALPSVRTSICSSATSLATMESYTSCASRVESSEDEVVLY